MPVHRLDLFFDSGSIRNLVALLLNGTLPVVASFLNSERLLMEGRYGPRPC